MLKIIIHSFDNYLRFSPPDIPPSVPFSRSPDPIIVSWMCTKFNCVNKEYQKFCIPSLIGIQTRKNKNYFCHDLFYSCILCWSRQILVHFQYGLINSSRMNKIVKCEPAKVIYAVVLPKTWDVLWLWAWQYTSHLVEHMQNIETILAT